MLVWPVKFIKDVPARRPCRVTLSNKHYVLWRTPDGVRAAVDACPHRKAKLSQGVVEDGLLACSYHFWAFDSNGTCVDIPQIAEGRRYPRACNLVTVPVTVSDGIVWMSEPSLVSAGIPTNLLSAVHPYDIVTDKELVVNNSYEIQIENGLDTAHLHTVHDGYQGSRARMSPIHCTWFYEDKDAIVSYFVHDSDTPDMELVFLKPGTIIVRVLDRRTKRLLRTNVINVAPLTGSTCTVLFRDIAPYTGGLPADPMLYRCLNRLVIDQIFKQDLAVTAAVQDNLGTSRSPYCMPAPADRPVAAFRRWVSGLPLHTPGSP